MVKIKNEHGITLVALIVTIIILIILAAVAIITLTKTNFIGIATVGTENYAEAQVNEKQKIDEMAVFLEEAVSNIVSASVNGGSSGSDTPTPDEPSITLGDEDIGKYVNYQPTYGTYWEDLDEDGLAKNMHYFSDCNYNSQISTEDNLKWRIWGIQNGNLLLVSDIETSQYLYIGNERGYNNGVTLLDNICNSCYKNSSYNEISVRNLKLEDITAITTVKNEYENEYGMQLNSCEFGAPYIWSTYEKNSKDEAINNRSTAYNLTSNRKSDPENITPYCTFWENKNMNTESAYTNAKYKELVITNDGYWLSSRYCGTKGDNNVYFGLLYVSSLGVYSSSNLVYHQGKQSLTRTRQYHLRPLVKIPLSSCTLKESSVDGMDYDISPR